MPVNVERIIERADAQLKRGEMEHIRRLREVSNRAYNDLAAEVRRRWPDAIEDAAGSGRSFREARARVLMSQLEPYTDALEYGEAGLGVREEVREMVTLGAQAGADNATELLSAYGMNLAPATAAIDPRAIEAAVTNSGARLARHSQQAISQIEQAVVNGVVRGEGSQKVTRGIREAIKGDTRIPEGGLHWRAERIARTELANAKGQATEQRYEEAGVEQVQVYATLDERVCPYCGARHGKVYKRGELELPFHPNCRCWLAPFREQFVEEGLVDQEMWAEQQGEIEQLQTKQVHDVTPFERQQGRTYPGALWTPKGGWTDRASAVTIAPTVPDAPSGEDPADRVKRVAEEGVSAHEEAQRTFDEAMREYDKATRALQRKGKRLRDVDGIPPTDPRHNELLQPWWDAESKAHANVQQARLARRMVVEEQRERVHGALREARNGEPIAWTRGPGRTSTGRRPRNRLDNADERTQNRAGRGEAWLREHTSAEHVPQSVEYSIDVRKPGTRAFANPAQNRVVIAEREQPGVVVHELGHVLEAQSMDVRAAGHEFLRRRTEGERLIPMPGAGYGKNEVTRPDRFFHPYVGKDYGNRYTEVISMGVEAMHDNPVKFLQDDGEHFELIARALSGRLRGSRFWKD